MKRRLAAILAADVVGYSRMMERDELSTLKRLTTLFQAIFNPAIRSEGGRVVKLMGDGALVEFSSVVAAITAAVQIQRDLDASDLSKGATPLRLRIGINLGDIVISGSDILGDGVNIAARLEALAEPGGICLSAAAYDQIQGRIEEAFTDMGDQQVKNISRPIRTYAWLPDGRDADEKLDQLASLTQELALASQENDKLPSIAVLPLDNMSNDPEVEHLADGLSEDIITLLARVPGFLVISRNSSFAYKGKSPDACEVGEALGVRYMIEGSLRPVGDKLRVTIQLIETADGRHIWADRFDCERDAAMEIQDEVTQKIIARLEPALSRAEIQHISRSPKTNPDAWQLYRQAAGLLSLRGWHRETFKEGAQLLRKAIELEPDFALAHAYLSLLMALGHMFDLVPEDEDSEAVVIESAERALEIDAYNSTVLGFTGCALCDIGHISRGIGILERALESDPSNAQAWVALGTAQIRAGKARKGVELLRHGMRLSPLDNRLAHWGTNLAYTLFRLRRKEEALEEARQACRRDDRHHMSRVVLAMIAADLGRDSEAKRAIKDALRIQPTLSGGEMKPLLGRKGVELLERKGLLAP